MEVMVLSDEHEMQYNKLEAKKTTTKNKQVNIIC